MLVCTLMACKSNKDTHEHGADAHTHNTVSENSLEDYFAAYSLEDNEFGTKTIVTITKNERIMVTNSLPNHSTGAFPNKGNPNTISKQNKTYNFPLRPKYIGKPQRVRETGIALNGIKFEPGTGEVVVCETGENYRVEAIQDLIDLGLDFNHAHVQPTGAYHYHGTPTAVINDFDGGEDLVHIGFAHDGFPMYYSKSNAYKPSYKLIDGIREGEDCTYTRPGISVTIDDNDHHDGTFNADYEFIEGSGDLDECNGITIDGKYRYLVTKDFPYVSRCLMGEFESEERSGPPPAGQDQGPGRGQTDARQLVALMDVDKDGKISLQEAKGPLKEIFSSIDANKDGLLSIEELEKEVTREKRPN